MHSPSSNKTFIKNISNQPVLDSPLIHMMAFHLQIQWLLPRSGKNHTFILNNHPSSICNCKPTRVLILKRTHTGMKENREIMLGSISNDFTYYYTSTISVRLWFWWPGWKRIATWKNLANFFKFNSCVPSRDWKHKQSFISFVISACRCKTF